MRKAIVNIERAGPPEEVTEKRAPRQSRFKKGGEVSRKMQHLGCISMCRAQEGDARWCSAARQGPSAGVCAACREGRPQCPHCQHRTSLWPAAPRSLGGMT